MTLLAMAVDPLKILTRRRRIRSLILSALMIAYIGFSFFLFFQWVAPSLDGRTDQHIAADSATYIYFADSLREGRVDPYVITSLVSFPNNLWSSVLLALVLKSTFAMALANYAMFFLALVLLKKSFSFSLGGILALLMLNATTTISLLSVNKEIVDLLAVSIFFFARQKHRHGVLFFALLLAFFNRFEVCIVMLLFLLAVSKLNPWRQRRAVTLVILIAVLSVLLPLFALQYISVLLDEFPIGKIGAWLDLLEMHYMYGVAVIPKIAVNFFVEIVNIFQVEAQRLNAGIANSYIALSNNLANVVVLLVLIIRRRFTMRSDIVYFAVLGCVFMAISPVIQPRYFYFAYVLLCLQAAHQRDRGPSAAFSPDSHKEIASV